MSDDYLESWEPAAGLGTLVNRAEMQLGGRSGGW